MTPRVCTADDGTEWSCVQAYAGLGDESPEAADAARVGDQVVVVATPSGGAQTVRLQLNPDWYDALSDDELARAIAAA